MYEDVTGLILAGGHSRRFGSDKTRHPVAGRPMIVRVAGVLTPLVSRLLISVRANQDTGLPLPHIRDLQPDLGPIGGLQAGLRAMATPWLCAVAADMPFLTEEALSILLDAPRSGAGAVLARTPDGRLQPLCALYAVHILPLVEQAIREGRLGLHALIDRLPHVREVELPADPLRNVNTPEDLLR